MTLWTDSKEFPKNEADINEKLLERPHTRRGGRGQGREGRSFSRTSADNSDATRRFRKRGNQTE